MSEAVGIYIHIPFCVRKCNYCDFPSYAGLDNLFDAYAEAVCREIVSAGEKFGKHAVDTVFVGGGTPTILPVPGMKQIMSTLNHVFHLEADAEVTLEANPGTVIARNAAAYRTMGFNRISIGLQAAQDHLLQMMGRIHTRELFLKCVDIVKSCGFSNLNADIIFGLPCQTMEDWQETLDLVLQNRLPHISCYSLKIEENTPWYELNEKGKLPQCDDDLERQMYYYAISELEKSGFRHYEISNFALPGFESKHNLRYWIGKPYIGFGAAAHSYIDNERSANMEKPSDYIRCMKENHSPVITSETIGPEENLSESFILGLRCIDGVSLKELERKFGPVLSKYMGKIELLQKQNLLCLEGDMLKLTKTGLDYANLVWMEFLDE